MKPNDVQLDAPMNSTTAIDPQMNRAISDFQSGLLSPVGLSERILQLASSTVAGISADVDRIRRTGFPEVIYAEGKPIDGLIAGAERLLQSASKGPHPEILVTRVNVEQARALGDQFVFVRWNARARTVRLHSFHAPLIWDTSRGQSPDDLHQDNPPRVAVVTAGTTDGNVAEEALETLAWMGVPTTWIQDVGVAGPYRILGHLEKLRSVAAVVVVAGMDGALPSVVAGYLGVPIFAVPTSVGYGANFGGISALLTMLNSCSSNVATVNIDAGFRGGFLAGLVAKSIAPPATSFNA